MPVSYGNSFNPSGGFLADLTTVFQQKLTEDSSLSWELLVKVFLGLTADINPVVVASVNSLISTVANQSSEELKQQFESEYAYVDDKVLQDVGAYTDDILNHGRRVLVVGHSQGNLYANAAYRLLYTNPAITTQSFKVVGVASPADFVAGGGPYVTSDKDMVINALRFMVASSTLPANVPVDFNENDISGHNFVATYMNSALYARSQIVGMVLSQLNNIEEPLSSYDYRVQMDISKIAGDGPDLPTYIPTYLCDSLSQLVAGCARTTLRYLTDHDGNAYDPDTSPGFAGTASTIIDRLAVVAPEVTDQRSAVNLFIRAQYPVLGTSSVEVGDGAYYYSHHFNSAGTFDPTPLLHFSDEFRYQANGAAAIMNYINQGTPATFYTSLPNTGQVFSESFDLPLADTALKLQGKVSYETGELETFSTETVRLSNLTYRMRVCRAEG
ncbi:hypothetical protein BTH42_31710 [Burkholderia sp. SRS-W-2-2016]|nr:hypothetical protein BTH42_31710 [Burkholderia sp. SRS-W-2-2016]